MPLCFRHPPSENLLLMARQLRTGLRHGRLRHRRLWHRYAVHWLYGDWYKSTNGDAAQGARLQANTDRKAAFLQTRTSLRLPGRQASRHGLHKRCPSLYVALTRTHTHPFASSHRTLHLSLLHPLASHTHTQSLTHIRWSGAPEVFIIFEK